MKKKNLLVALLIFVSFIFTWCQNNNWTWYSGTETVKIWVIAPLTDAASAFWIDAVNVYNFSVKKFNETHDDVKVKLIIEDGKCEWTSAVNAIQKLINIDNIDVLLWGWCSSETLAAWPIAQERHLTTLAAWSSSPDIVNIWDYVYRFWNDNISSTKLAEYMNWKYNKTMAIYTNDAGQIWLYEAFLNKYEWEVMSLKINIGEEDYSMIVQQLANKKDSIDSIVLFWHDDFTIWILKELQNFGLLEQFRNDIFGWYQMSSNEVIDALGVETLEWMKQVNANMETLWSTEKWQMYIQQFKENYDVQWVETFVYFDADGIELLLEAIENWARKSEDFKLYFDSITSENPRDGILWNYYFNEDREADWLEDAIELQEIHNGVWVNI